MNKEKKQLVNNILFTIELNLDDYALQAIENFASLWDQSDYLSFGFIMNKKGEYSLLVDITENKKSLRNGYIVDEKPKNVFWQGPFVTLWENVVLLNIHTEMIVIESEEI